MLSKAEYPRRRNRDGTWGSVCTKCYMAIGRCATEDKLAEMEKSHVCYSSFLAERGGLSDTAEPVRDRDAA
jgi:hypothetical protein